MKIVGNDVQSAGDLFIVETKTADIFAVPLRKSPRHVL